VLPERLVDEIRAGLADAGIECPATVRLERPLRVEHGDYSSPVALRAGNGVARTSCELAELLAHRLRRTKGVGDVAVAGAGHLNVWLSPDGLAETVRRLAGERTEQHTAGTVRTPDDETTAHLAMLLRGADALGVSPTDPDLDDLAGTEQRRLICLLAETKDLARRRPDRLARHTEEIRDAWQRIEAVQPILPKGDSPPNARHAAGRLLAAATYATLTTSGVH
jgi:hypothetical protein